MREEDRHAAKKTGQALKSGFAAVATHSDAAAALDRVETAAGELQEQEIPPKAPSTHSAEQAEAIDAAAHSTTREERPGSVLAKTAVELAAAPPENRQALDAGVEEASSEAGESWQVRRGRSLLRSELLKRLQPLDAIDARLFIRINHLPHPGWLDTLVSRFSWFMTGGHAWILFIALNAFLDRRRATRAALEVLPALYLATYTVEIPIKAYFRRRRPFISIVRAIVVGRKPGSHSFPSGHSAAAFAGASLLASRYPQTRGLLWAIAGLVAFSRVYLGAHYPADVLSGGLAGAGLARAYRPLLARLFRHWPDLSVR